jgi:hypothetical protein
LGHVVLSAEKSEIFLWNVVKNGFSSAFRALQLGELELKLLEVFRFEKSNELALAFLASEGNVD